MNADQMQLALLNKCNLQLKMQVLLTADQMQLLNADQMQLATKCLAAGLNATELGAGLWNSCAGKVGSKAASRWFWKITTWFKCERK